MNETAPDAGEHEGEISSSFCYRFLAIVMMTMVAAVGVSVIHHRRRRDIDADSRTVIATVVGNRNCDTAAKCRYRRYCKNQLFHGAPR